MEIWEEINSNEALLEASLKTLKSNGAAAAEAERDYRVAKTKAILMLRDKGYPTTLIPEIVKGLKDVAELDFRRNVAYVVYYSNKEAINVYKKKSDDLRAIYEKEWVQITKNS